MELRRCPRFPQRLAVIAATGFGLGLAPLASGTVGALPGILLALIPSATGLPWPAQIAAAVALAILAIPLCGIAERHFGRKDDGRIVADEYMTFPICMLGLPPEPHLLAIAFLISRFFDIAKLPPARRMQNLPGGLGIVVDDVIACLQTLAVMHILYRSTTG